METAPPVFAFPSHLARGLHPAQRWEGVAPQAAYLRRRESPAAQPLLSAPESQGLTTGKGTCRCQKGVGERVKEWT